MQSKSGVVRELPPDSAGVRRAFCVGGTVDAKETTWCSLLVPCVW